MESGYASAVPGTLPEDLGTRPSEPTSKRSLADDFFTPKVMGIATLILGLIIVALWVGGAFADAQTHKRVTGEDVGVLESMFNDLGTPSGD